MRHTQKSVQNSYSNSETSPRITDLTTHHLDPIIRTEPLLPTGEDGTITADLTVGTPPQQITVQLDTGSQKYLGTKIGKFCQKDMVILEGMSWGLLLLLLLLFSKN